MVGAWRRPPASSSFFRWAGRSSNWPASNSNWPGPAGPVCSTGRGPTCASARPDYTCRLHLAPVVEEMERAHGVTIEVVPGSELELDRHLRDRVIDLAITSLSGRQILDTVSEPLFAFEPVLLLPKDVPEMASITTAHQLLAQNPVPHRLICAQPEDGICQVVSRALAEMRVRWPEVQHLKTTAMVAAMVAHGRRPGLSLNLPGLNDHPNVRPLLLLRGFPPVKYGALYRQPASPAVLKLVPVLKRVAAEYRANISTQPAPLDGRGQSPGGSQSFGLAPLWLQSGSGLAVRRRLGPGGVTLQFESFDLGGRRHVTLLSPSAKATEDWPEEPEDRANQERPEGRRGGCFGGLRRRAPGRPRRASELRCLLSCVPWWRNGFLVGFAFDKSDPLPAAPGIWLPGLAPFGLPPSPIGFGGQAGSADSLADAPRIAGSIDRPLMSLLPHPMWHYCHVDLAGLAPGHLPIPPEFKPAADYADGADALNSEAKKQTALPSWLHGF